MPSSRTSRHRGAYFYRPGELLVPGEQADLFRRTATAVQVDFGEGSDNIAIPRGEGHERAEGFDGTVLTGAARFMGVTLGGEFDPEGVINELQREAGRTGATLDVTPNHVIFGAQHWLIEPCGDPSMPGPEEHLSRHPGGEGVVVAVIDSGLPEGYTANPLMAPVQVANSQELEPFPYEGPMPGGGMLQYAQGHGAFVCGVVRQQAEDAEVWSYRALDSLGTTDEWALGVQLALAIGQQHPRSHQPLARDAHQTGPDCARAHRSGPIGQQDRRFGTDCGRRGRQLWLGATVLPCL